VGCVSNGMLMTVGRLLDNEVVNLFYGVLLAMMECGVPKTITLWTLSFG